MQNLLIIVAVSPIKLSADYNRSSMVTQIIPSPVCLTTSLFNIRSNPSSHVLVPHLAHLAPLLITIVMQEMF